MNVLRRGLLTLTIAALALPAPAARADDFNFGETESVVVSAEADLPADVADLSVQSEGADSLEGVAAISNENVEATHGDDQNLEGLGGSAADITPVDAPVVSGPETTPSLIVTTFEVTSGLEFIEGYNQSGGPIAIDTISFRVVSRDGSSCTTKINDYGWVLAGEFFYITSPLSASGDSRLFTNDCEVDGEITRLEIFQGDVRLQLIDGIKQQAGKVQAHQRAWTAAGKRSNFSSLKQDGTFDNQYRLISLGTESLRDSEAYNPPTQTNLKISELMTQAMSDCLPSSDRLECGDYVKIINQGDVGENLAMFRVRVGSKSSNASVTTSFNWHQPTLNPLRDELVLEPGEFFILHLRNDGQNFNLSNDSSQVWIEDYLGVKIYDEIAYSGMDKAAARDMSWAYDAVDAAWRFGLPSPLTYENNFPEPGKGGELDGLKECAEGQFRNPETNRCKKIASVDDIADCGEGRERNPATNRCRNIPSAASLAPCKEGQYRSEETNRCRSIAAAASALKPCADDQFRNPETNRCKKIAADSDVLKECAEGYERNPDTNRCRKVLSAEASTVPFAPEKVQEVAGGTLGWWAFGGLGTVALGYAGWQWRFEVGRLIRRAAGAFSSTGK